MRFGLPSWLKHIQAGITTQLFKSLECFALHAPLTGAIYLVFSSYTVQPINTLLSSTHCLTTGHCADIVSILSVASSIMAPQMMIVGSSYVKRLYTPRPDNPHPAAEVIIVHNMGLNLPFCIENVCYGEWKSLAVGICLETPRRTSSDFARARWCHRLQRLCEYQLPEILANFNFSFGYNHSDFVLSELLALIDVT